MGNTPTPPSTDRTGVKRAEIHSSASLSFADTTYCTLVGFRRRDITGDAGFLSVRAAEYSATDAASAGLTGKKMRPCNCIIPFDARNRGDCH